MRKLRNILGIAGTLLELALIVLCVDAICWVVSYSCRNIGASKIRSKCAGVKVGMSSGEAIKVMHSGFTPWEESRWRPRSATVDELYFWSPAGACVAELDSSTGSIAKVQFSDRWGPIE